MADFSVGTGPLSTLTTVTIDDVIFQVADARNSGTGGYNFLPLAGPAPESANMPKNFEI